MLIDKLEDVKTLRAMRAQLRIVEAERAKAQIDADQFNLSMTGAE